METAKEYFKPEYFENRELSWIKFDERVLNEARDRNDPVVRTAEIRKYHIIEPG